jgi:hypothetical protein
VFELDDETFLDVARHEAGHIVMARKIGFSTGGIKISSLQAQAEIDLFPSITNTTEALAFLEGRVKVLYAGALAESLHDGEIDCERTNGFLESTATHDFAKIRELVRIAAGILSPGVSKKDFEAELERVNQTWGREAGEIVEANANLIHALVDHMLMLRRRWLAQHPANVLRPLVVTEAQIDEFFQDKQLI